RYLTFFGIIMAVCPQIPFALKTLLFLAGTAVRRLLRRFLLGCGLGFLTHLLLPRWRLRRHQRRQNRRCRTSGGTRQIRRRCLHSWPGGLLHWRRTRRSPGI